MMQEIFEMIMDYEKVKDKLKIRLDTKEYEEPHVRAFADVLAYFEINLGDSAAHVSYLLQNKWGKTSAELYEDALNNIEVEYDNTFGVFTIVTVSGMFHGASAILKAKLEKGDVIIPSSIHECLIVKDINAEEDKEYIEEMIKTINETEVDERERLSDHMYVFNGKEIVKA